MSAILALENGQVFDGISVGVPGWYTGEVVFNTAMTGYQEVLTDPSYAQQMIVFTTAHIGNTGINYEDSESNKVWAKGAIIQECCASFHSWRAQLSLTDYFKAQQVAAIAGVDTRALTHMLRTEGAMHGCIITEVVDENDRKLAIKRAQRYGKQAAADLTKLVTTDEKYYCGSQQGDACKLVILDFGVKQGIIDVLTALNCQLVVVPAGTTLAEIMALKPDGVVLSNGPGDPKACSRRLIKVIQQLISSSIPLLGICLGHQLLGLALGAKTYKMKFGHHGCNHPVQSLVDQKVYITTQNHGFAIAAESLPTSVQITHKSLFDGSLQGFCAPDRALYAFQGHPEASPGPWDARAWFDDFLTAVAKYKVGHKVYAET